MDVPAPAISINALTKDFPLAERGRYLRAVDNLSLQVEENSVFGLLGPNGSGKSTTIRILLGLSQPSSGAIRLFGEDPNRPEARRRIGYLPDAPYFHKFLSGYELLSFHGKLLGLSKEVIKQRAEALLSRFGLGDAMKRKLGGYSKGMLQRLGFAQAMLGDPDLLVLDEPTAGVDPIGAAELGEFVKSLKTEGKTVLLCSHLLSQVQDLCDQVGILNRGKLLACGSIENLLRNETSGPLSVEGLGSEARRDLETWVRDRGGQLRFGNRELEQYFRELVRSEESEGLK